MNIWNKVFVGLILVVSLPTLYLAARTLRTHQVWQEAAAKLEQQIAQLEAEVDKLEHGDPETGAPSVHELELALHNRILERGRAWYGVVPIQVARAQHPVTKAPTLQVSIDPKQKGPHGLTPRTIVYAFEATDFEKGGRYLGQFEVTNVAQNGPVQLMPVTLISQREANRLQKSKGPWILYDQMPRDEEDVFAELTDDQIKALFPGSSQKEYLQRKGRKLRDYVVLFTEFHRRFTILTDRLNAARDDIRYLKDAEANALAQEQANQHDIQAAKTELAQVTEERDLVAKHLAAIQQAIAFYQRRSGELVQQIRTLAGQLASLQREAIRRVDARTREMARAASP